MDFGIRVVRADFSGMGRESEDLYDKKLRLAVQQMSGIRKFKGESRTGQIPPGVHVHVGSEEGLQTAREKTEKGLDKAAEATGKFLQRVGEKIEEQAEKPVPPVEEP